MKDVFSLPLIILGALFCCLLSTLTVADNLQSDTVEVDSLHTISLVLLGRRGSGITSTVRQILGPKANIHTAEVAVASTDILEYTLRVPCSKGKDYNYFKIVDVPGLELGDNLEQDAEILSTLKSYLHDKGLPSFFLVVSRFDEKDFAEENSQFRQLLKRFELLQRALFQATTDNTIFLLTRLLSEPADIQQSPQGRIDEFRKIIQQATTIPSPIEILVGDNKPDSTVQIENGFYKFPNNELYPKNILDKLLQVAERSVSVQAEDKHAVQEIINTLEETRETTQYQVQEHVAHPSDEDIFENDLEAFEYLLRQDNLDLPANEIQLVLQTAYDKKDATTQINSCVQLLALRVALRNLHLMENIQELPQTLEEQVSFFQNDAEGVMTSKYALYYLKHVLALEAPEFPTQDLAVGLGYDIVHDRLLHTTPFLRNAVKRPSSSLGYLFPDYVECERLAAIEEVIFANATESEETYHQERLKYLAFSDKDKVEISQLKGESKPYLNLKPNDNKKLSAVKEIRLLECKMTVENDSIAVVDESFTSVVNALPRLNTSCQCSLRQWRLFLQSYGTHIVTKSYGGGCYHGTVLLPVENSLTDKDNVGSSLDDIVHFKNLESSVAGSTQLYQFYVGGWNEVDPRASRIHQLGKQDQETILSTWKNQLNAEFEMLTNEIELVPLSQLIKILNIEKGADTEAATLLLYQGKLGGENAAWPPAPTADKLREKAIRQSLKLKSANSQKSLEQINRFNKFVDETTS